jgi:hypothetical protein
MDTPLKKAAMHRIHFENGAAPVSARQQGLLSGTPASAAARH